MKETVHSPRPAPRPAPQDPATALAALVGREFVEALGAGLRRARAVDRRGAGQGVRWAAGAPQPLPAAEPSAVSDPEPRAAAAAGLLNRKAAAVLRRFEAALPAALTAAGVTRRVSRPALSGWAREALRAAAHPGQPSYAKDALLDAEQRFVAATLLLECAAAALPSGHPASGEALRAVARAVRSPRPGATPGRTRGR
ncbi:hypothetical protein ACFYWY_24435 [Streptomyces sp. NPDC002870]|uniref:hypothetical protein n=1 Tax=Streptomyces sp. NPDC002870 TaxID=3364666 RepID=UPI0036A16062